MNLSDRIIKLEKIYWKGLQVLQPSSFKDLSSIDKSRLKASLISNHFAEPFYVWEDKEIIYCLDGKHRIELLKELESEGKIIPDMLPAVFVECKDKREAAELVILYSAIYAKVTQLGFGEMLKEFDIDFEKMKSELSLPDFDMSGFELMNINPIESTFTKEAKGKPATMRITFVDPTQLENAKPKIEELLKEFSGSFLSVSSGEI